MYRDDNTYKPLTLFEYDHKPGNYCLMLTDAHMGAVEAAFTENDREGNGYGWADTALAAMRAHAPELEARLGIDPEAGMFVAYGDDLDALKELGSLLHAAYHDREKLSALVKVAPFEYD